MKNNLQSCPVSMTDFDADRPIAYIVDPVYTVELRDDFWLWFTIFGDTLRVTCTTNEKQATGIVNLELAKEGQTSIL